MQPAMEKLSQQTGETINLAVPDGTGILNVAEVPATFILGCSSGWTGRRTRPHAVANGKVLLAYGAIPVPRHLERYTDQTITEPEALAAELARVRASGYATAVGELEDGLVAVAAPVLDAAGALRGGAVGVRARVPAAPPNHCPSSAGSAPRLRHEVQGQGPGAPMREHLLYIGGGWRAGRRGHRPRGQPVLRRDVRPVAVAARPTSTTAVSAAAAAWPAWAGGLARSTARWPASRSPPPIAAAARRPGRRADPRPGQAAGRGAGRGRRAGRVLPDGRRGRQAAAPGGCPPPPRPAGGS